MDQEEFRQLLEYYQEAKRNKVGMSACQKEREQCTDSSHEVDGWKIGMARASTEVVMVVCMCALGAGGPWPGAHERTHPSQLALFSDAFSTVCLCLCAHVCVAAL